MSCSWFLDVFLGIIWTKIQFYETREAALLQLRSLLEIFPFNKLRFYPCKSRCIDSFFFA